ncbi:hypothetical protein HID58_077833 [Brassica napus]|uniref:Uncharacterized protein n=1 Tax=Brassica napus TaxID=3708 RepID=A0ABQ7YRP2_BRANA|nr:hypothetical protein HID58_077833 [Brassica napus]
MEIRVLNQKIYQTKMGRSPCCDQDKGVKKGPWMPEEDYKLVAYIDKNGYGKWRSLPNIAGLNRCGKSCRLRWMNYLRPDIRRGEFTEEEENGRRLRIIFQEGPITK